MKSLSAAPQIGIRWKSGIAGDGASLILFQVKRSQSILQEQRLGGGLVSVSFPLCLLIQVVPG